MVLAPQRATLTLTVGGTPVLGLFDITPVDKTTMQDITCDTNSAIVRFPTIDDGDFKISCYVDPADPGQMALDAGKVAHTKLSLVGVKGTRTFTLTGYIQDRTYNKGPKDVQECIYTVAVTNGIAVT